MRRTSALPRAGPGAWVLAGMLALVACDCGHRPPLAATLTLLHSPIHPGNGEKVRLTVRLEGERAERIDLEVFEYQLDPDQPGHATARRGGMWGLEKRWDSPSNAPLEIELTGFPRATVITYRARATAPGRRAVEASVSFAAGDWPWADLPTPIYRQGEPARQIDVCLVPDVDFGKDWARFVPKVESLVYEGYLRNAAIRSGWKNWSFYYTRLEGDAEDAATRLEVPTTIRASVDMDAFGILHAARFRDGRQGRIFSSEPERHGTVVHETGHAVFDLADEYCGEEAFYTQAAEAPNLFSSSDACEEYRTAGRFEDVVGSCELLGEEEPCDSWHRPEPAVYSCVMNDDGDAAVREFGRACGARIELRYARLAGETP